jgi:hypothetical protein
MRPVALWLEEQLDFPNWRADSIRAMPETHISKWAAENKVDVDPRYSTEHRSGGTRALGDDVPALSREQLTVLPLEEWQKDKVRFVYEEWMAEAKRRLGR